MATSDERMAVALAMARRLLSGEEGQLAPRPRAAVVGLVALLDVRAPGDRPVETNDEFDLAELARDLALEQRFAARARRLVLEVRGGAAPVRCDPKAARGTLGASLAAAMRGAPEGARVLVEIRRQGRQVEAELSAPGWEPGAAPAAAQSTACRLLRTASGARLLITLPAA